MATKLTDREQSWQEIGRGYGYPECCINHFIMLNRKYIASGWRFKYLYGDDHKYHDGYIPCPKCHNLKRIKRKRTYKEYVRGIIKYGDINDGKPWR